MKTNLSRRLTLWVGAPALLLFGGVVWIASHRGYSRVVKETEQYTRTLARSHAAQLETRLARAAKIPENLALFVETHALDSEEKLTGFLRQVLEKTPEVFGTCVAFEPDRFTPGKHFYAPYFYWKDGQPEFVQLGNPDYDYFRWEWYTRPRELKRAVWTEPYFDEGGGNALMTTYSAPIWRGGEFRGVATIDIAMSQLMMQSQDLQVGQTGYVMIVSRSGKFVAFPDSQKLMKASIQEVSPELGARMLAGGEGFVKMAGPHSGKPAWVAYLPVEDGEFFLAIVYPEAEVLQRALHLQWEVLALGAAGLIGVILALAVVARSIARPMTELARAAQRIAAGDLDQDVHVEARTSEVRDLAVAFRKMTRDLKMRMEELRYTTLVKERFEGELSAARSIQFSLLAKRFPVFPDRHEIDLHAVIKPAHAVGGDFYDFYFIDRDCLCLVAADVAGKGVPAALFMSVSKTLVRANAPLAGSPSEMMAKVNNELCAEGATSGMFVSLAFALLNVQTGELRLCSAGHPAPMRVSRGGGVEPLKSEPGVALGAWQGTDYKTATHQLHRGDTLVFFTDGVTEALSPDEKFYSADRLQGLLGKLANAPVDHITRAVLQDVREFRSTREQADDLTLLAVRWHGNTASAFSSS